MIDAVSAFGVYVEAQRGESGGLGTEAHRATKGLTRVGRRARRRAVVVRLDTPE